MKAPLLLRAEAAAEQFHTLLAAADECGLRIGWLEFGGGDEALGMPSPAAQSAACRVVLAAPQATISYKRRRGPAVLRDLLRENFLGFRLVLVQGEFPPGGFSKGSLKEEPTPVPLLQPSGEDWQVVGPFSRKRTYTTEAFLAALRRPNPWSDLAVDHES